MTYIDDTIRDLDARWKELTGLSSGRKKDLDENYKLSHKFFKGAEELLNMLDEAERSLKDEEPIGVDPAHLRSQLKKHKVCECLFFFTFLSPLCLKSSITLFWVIFHVVESFVQQNKTSK